MQTEHYLFHVVEAICTPESRKSLYTVKEFP